MPFLLAEFARALLAIGDDPARRHELARRLGEDCRRARQRKAAFQSTRIYNSLLVIGDKGEVLDGYDKIHLVPFGEYLPFQDFMESLGILQMTGVRGGFSAGTGPRLLTDPGAPPARPLICYEIIFPDEVTDNGDGRAGSST